jgi:WD40 repeat protein
MARAEAEMMSNPIDHQPVIQNPYVGPRPFTTDEKDRFFGRDQEASQLIPLVIAERLVLFYSQSGAGKSSLINARLIPGLEQRNFKVLTGRVSGQAAEVVDAENVFTYNLLLGLEHAAGRGASLDAQRLAHMTLAEYLADLEIEPVTETAPVGWNGAAQQAAEEQVMLVDAPQVIGGLQPLALIIDQFEEIFTTNPGAWAQRVPFFEQLSRAMEEDPYLWVVLALREDYVAALDPYAPLLPGKLRARYYMQRMSYQAALEAVCKPVENLRPFDDDAAEELVHTLSLIAVGKDQNNRTVYEPGQFIEPVQLQVVCFQLWEELKAHPGERITREDLLGLARGKDLAQFISDALANFYENALAEVLKQFPTLSERKLRMWFLEELITEAETRNSVRQGKEVTGTAPNDMPNEVVKALQDRFIIRAEIRGQNTWYELSHDRFVVPVLQSNRAWIDRNPRPIETAAEAWLESGKDPSRLYDGRQLENAVAMWRANPDDLSESAVRFLEASQQATGARQRRRQQIAVGALTVLLLLVSTLAAFAYSNWRTVVAQKSTVEAAAELERVQKYTVQYARDVAEQQARTATVAQGQAIQQAQTATVAQGQAIQQAHTATVAQGQAVQQAQTATVAQGQAVQQAQTATVAQGEAVVQSLRAEAESRVSQARQLSALSDYFRPSQLDLSALLSVYSVRLSDDWSTRKALLQSIQTSLPRQMNRLGFQMFVNNRPYSIAVSPDGKRMAVGGIGGVDLMDVETMTRLSSLPPEFAGNATIFSLAFDSTNQVLARGGDDGVVRFYDLNAGRMLGHFRPFGQGEYSSVTAVAFRQEGGLLAVATARDPANDRIGRVFFYNYVQNVVEREINCGRADCLYIAWSPKGDKLAIGTGAGSIFVYDMNEKKMIMDNPRAHTDEITGLAWYPDNRRLVSGGVDQRVALWDTATREKLTETKRQDTPIIISLALSPDGHYLVTGVNDEKTEKSWVYLWDADNLQRIKVSMLGPTLPVAAVAFHPQEMRFVTASNDKSLFWWEYKPVESLSKILLDGNRPRAEGITTDENGNFLFSRLAGNAGIEVIGEDGQSRGTLPSGQSSLILTRWQGRPVLGAGDYNGQVGFLDLTNSNVLLSPLKLANGSIRALAVSDDGNLLAAAFCLATRDCDNLVLADLRTGARLAVPAGLQDYQLEVITALAVNPDGKSIAIGGPAGQLLIYDLEKEEIYQVSTDELTQGRINLSISSLAFSPAEENLLVVGFHTGQIALWKADSRGPVGEFIERTNDEVTGLTFRKDDAGRWVLLSVSARGEVRQWDISLQSWIERACLVAGRELTDEEKSSYLPAGVPQAPVCPNQ